MQIHGVSALRSQHEQRGKVRLPAASRYPSASWTSRVHARLQERRSEQPPRPRPPLQHAQLQPQPPSPRRPPRLTLDLPATTILLENDQMATTDSPSYARQDQPPQAMSTADVIAFVKSELDADVERQAKISATELPHESQTGSTVDLSFKGIQSLPVEVVSLIRDKVERLALSHNPNCRLPREIIQCDRLRYLNLRWNKLDRFPIVVLGLCKLEILDISKNDVPSIPEDISKMTSLKFLAMSRNNIKRLPLALGAMSNLAKIKFDDNPIEFPPAEILHRPTDNKLTFESEREKEICLRIKKFLKSAAMKEKLRVHSEDDQSTNSESNVETPRPAKRATGRFPIRPSMSGIDLPSELFSGLSDSPPMNDHPPPIPLRSHARGLSSSTQSNSRPSTARAELAQGTRNRSDTFVSAQSVRDKRRGIVPPKNPQLGSVQEMPGLNQSPMNTTPHDHSRHPSTVSITNSMLSFGAQTPSSATSPATTLTSRKSSVSASPKPMRNTNQPALMQTSFRAIKRALYMLNYLHQPIADTAQQVRGRSPKRSPLERSLFSAKALVDELGQQLAAADRTLHHRAIVDPSTLLSLLHTSMSALKLYASVAKEVKRSRKMLLQNVDQFHIRSIIKVAQSTTTEVLNLCQVLGFPLASAQARQDATPRVSQIVSKRDVSATPSPQWPANNARWNHGANSVSSSTQSTSSRPSRRQHPSASSQASTNSTFPTMTTASLTEPLSGPTYVNGKSRTSRSNTLRSVISESEGEGDPAERVCESLKRCCNLAQSILPNVSTDLKNRKAMADSKGDARESHCFYVAINKCGSAIATNAKLSGKLQLMQDWQDLKKPGKGREIWSLCEAFTKDWAGFAEQVMRFPEQKIDIGSLKHNLKPIQRAVKEANKAVQYLTANQLRPHVTPPPMPALNGMHGFPYAVTPSGPTSHTVPATPLAAALGTAAQSVLPNSSMYLPHDHFAPSGQFRGRMQQEARHDRNDTVMQPPLPTNYIRR